MPSALASTIGGPAPISPVAIPPGTQPYTMVAGHPIFKIGGRFFTESGLPYSPGQFLGPQTPPASNPGPDTPGAMPPVGNMPPPPPQPGAMPPVLPRLNPTSSPAGPAVPPMGGSAPAYGMAAQAPQPGPMDASLMSAPPPGPSGDMPTYDQRMDQASMPAGQVAQAGSSLPLPLDKPPAPAADSLPIPAKKPPQPGMGIEGGWQDGKQIAERGAKPAGKRRVAAKAAPPTDSSESDALNNQQVALAIAQRLAGNRAQG